MEGSRLHYSNTKKTTIPYVPNCKTRDRLEAGGGRITEGEV